MSKLEKQKEKARSLETKDPRAAIEVWLEALKAQEDDGDPNPDLSIFNRIGYLYLKVKDPAQAADYYDRAVDKYAELGFHNKAIAMCNKVLRNAPGRHTTKAKLAKLYAAKGFVSEAKLHFVEYAERMQKIGKIQHAFAALKEFTDISPENTQLRGMLEEHLLMYGTAERRPSTRAPSPAAPPPPHDDVSKSGKRKTSSLVFLDVDAPPGPKGKPVAPPLRPPEPEPEDAPLAQSLVESVTPDPDTSLEIESTSLAEEVEPPGGDGTRGTVLEGFESTSAEFGQVQLDASGVDVPSLREDETADVRPLAELEPTVPAEADEPERDIELEPMLDHEIEIEPPPPAPPAPPPRPAPSARSAPPKITPVVPKRPGGPGGPAGGGAPPAAAPGARPGVGSPARVGVPQAPGPQQRR